MKSSRLIIVSNRLPFRISGESCEYVFTPSSGGLVSSIRSYLQQPAAQGETAVWVGSIDLPEKEFLKHAEANMPDNTFELAPVFLMPSIKEKFYNGFCNDTLWPLFHYFPSYAKFKDDHYDAYVRANQLFCDKIVSLYQPGDTIWVHDYHLLLLPGMLRKRLPEAAIGFFLHIPFPSFELFRMLPATWRKEILEGMLGADLVGFHTNDYVQYFLKSVRQLLGYDTSLRMIVTADRSVAADAFPVSIDYRKFNAASNDPEIFSERNRIRKTLGAGKLVISVDRLDYTKGIVNRLEAIELFLEEHPEWLENFTYLLIVVPSRDAITKYKENKETIEGLISRINGRFGSIGWTPVIYQYKSYGFPGLAALYLAADVALITPIRDGMNLVAKEFVACRCDRRAVLILSETAGAAAELGEALVVNPRDRRQIAAMLEQALTMPLPEQLKRNEMMQQRLKSYDVVKWADDFLSQLEHAREKQRALRVKELNVQSRERLTGDYAKAQERLLLLDYDGTLAPIERFPHLATPSAELRKTLETLARDPRNEIVIMSGRSKTLIGKWLGDLPVHLVAEHGAFIKKPGGDWERQFDPDDSWQDVVRAEMEKFSERCAGSFVEEKESSLAWHYRNSDKEQGFLRSRELINRLTELAAQLNFQIVQGKKVVEARPRGIDKGRAAMPWLQPGRFVLAAGDDRTDEDLFRVIPPEGYSIRIGLTQSLARFNLKHQKDFVELLGKIAAESSGVGAARAQPP